MHSKSNNIVFMLYDDRNEVANEPLEPLLSRYQIGLETSITGRNFIFDLVQLLYCKCHKINFKRSGSYIDSPDWIKGKKATRNPKNEDDKSFEYFVAVALNYGEIKLDNWKGINYPTKTDDWKTFQINNPTIAYIQLIFQNTT